jgi:glutamine synthetase
MNPTQLNKASGNADAFNCVISAIVAAVDKNGDLMRMAIASPGNDFRLGACEAPPAIVSTYLGDDLTKYLESYMSGSASGGYTPTTKMLSSGISTIAPFEVPSEDRNRTSPFPYGGHRFEFRAVGSSQNPSLVNTVLNTITADAFADMSAKIEAGAKPKDAAIETLKKHFRIVFNGNGSVELLCHASSKGPCTLACTLFTQGGTFHFIQ